MKILTIAVFGVLIIGCAKNTDPLVVKMQTVRDQNTLSKEDPMVDHEKAVRLYGAVSMQERRQRLGQYYTVLWNADAGVNKEISFEYQQGNSGSKIKTIKRHLDVDAVSGKEEFSVIGDNYFDNGLINLLMLFLLYSQALRKLQAD
jgi:hypothetical protein